MDRLAHDLRGPLSPMLTAVYLLREVRTTPAQRDELLDVMQRQILRLGDMIDEVSDLGRAEKGRLLGRREPIDLELLVADVVARLHARPPDLSCAADVPGIELDGDVLRLGQLFRLLLDMRLARGDAAPVQARLERAGDHIRLTCTLHSGDASEAYAQALLTAPHPDPPDEALGLGTLIASAIAQAHGGRLSSRHAGGDVIEVILELPVRVPDVAAPGD